jgi:tight adherence protein C
MEIVIGLLAFGCVFLIVLAAGAIIQTPTIDRRLARLSGSTDAVQTTSESLVRGRQGGLAGFFHKVGERSETTETGALRSRLIHAGYRSLAAPAIYYGIRIILAIGLPMIAAVTPALWTLNPIHQILIVLGLAAFGFIGPSAFVDGRANRRKHKLTRALPDALDLMVVCVEAGFGINQTLSRVSEEFHARSPILAHEFQLVAQETRAGKSTTDSLRSLATRTGVGDISSLVALLVQTERFGTSMAAALGVHADAMRIRRMQHAEERAQKATLKLILPSTLIFAALLLIFVSPGFMALSGAIGGK